jgi:hypothetical protein
MYAVRTLFGRRGSGDSRGIGANQPSSVIRAFGGAAGQVVGPLAASCAVAGRITPNITAAVSAARKKLPPECFMSRAPSKGLMQIF